ncbi:MAG: hypothetical protein Q4F96_04515, partial [Bacillota bacterium]|nr:hypothetical protein [Bacillota bacterium]
MRIDRELEQMLRRVEKPARYIGGETNIVRKEPAEGRVRMGFAFPDTYEIGMSYLGLQILYHILNKNEDIFCERVFAPAMDMEELMRKEGRRLFTLETFTPVDELDLLGFTLQYEMSYSNVLNMLDLGGIPLRAAERMAEDPEGTRWPVVIAGGPCAFSPEPLAPFIDAFLIGDGEELLEQVCLAYRDARAQWRTEDGAAAEDHAAGGHAADGILSEGGFRGAFLRRIAALDGVYVPSFYEPVYGGDGRLREMRRLQEAAPERIRRAMVPDIEKADFPVDNLVSLIETIHDRSVVETFRGCTRGCR